jgi:hypothetical protein
MIRVAVGKNIPHVPTSGTLGTSDASASSSLRRLSGEEATRRSAVDPGMYLWALSAFTGGVARALSFATMVLSNIGLILGNRA